MEKAIDLMGLTIARISIEFQRIERDLTRDLLEQILLRREMWFTPEVHLIVAKAQADMNHLYYCLWGRHIHPDEWESCFNSVANSSFPRAV